MSTFFVFTFGNLLELKKYIFQEIRDIDYADFDDIIVDHLGEDVSKFISNMTMSKFAANS